MPHWTEEFIGRAYVKDEHDCATFVRDVVRQRLGFEIEIMEESEWRRLSPQDLVDFSKSFANKTDNPVECDAVLMRILGSRRSLGSHVGLFVPINGRQYVLHNLEKLGTLLTWLPGLKSIHLECCGFYSWSKPGKKSN